MPKHKSRSTVNGFELQLAGLLDKVSPGKVTLSKTRPMFDGRPGYEVEIDTRESKIVFVVETLAEGVEAAADAIDSGEEDPIRPAWRRLTRFQREVVRRTLEALASKHMARAAAAKIANSRTAHSEYELADAFHAAFEELQFDNVDHQHIVQPNTEKLAAEPVKLTGRPRSTTRTVQ